MFEATPRYFSLLQHSFRLCYWDGEACVLRELVLRGK